MLDDLDFISENLNITKADWIRYSLAKSIKTAKEEIISKYNDRYSKGYLTDDEYKVKVGSFPSKWLKRLKKVKEEEKKKMEELFRKNVGLLLQNAKSTTDDLHFDKYFSKVVSKINRVKINKKLKKYYNKADSKKRLANVFSEDCIE